MTTKIQGRSIENRFMSITIVDFEWDEYNSMVHVIRVEMSSAQFRELKALAAVAGKTMQKFTGDVLKEKIRNNR